MTNFKISKYFTRIYWKNFPPKGSRTCGATTRVKLSCHQAQGAQGSRFEPLFPHAGRYAVLSLPPLSISLYTQLKRNRKKKRSQTVHRFPGTKTQVSIKPLVPTCWGHFANSEIVLMPCFLSISISLFISASVL